MFQIYLSLILTLFSISLEGSALAYQCQAGAIHSGHSRRTDTEHLRSGCFVEVTTRSWYFRYEYPNEWINEGECSRICDENKFIVVQRSQRRMPIQLPREVIQLYRSLPSDFRESTSVSEFIETQLPSPSAWGVRFLLDANVTLTDSPLDPTQQDDDLDRTLTESLHESAGRHRHERVLPTDSYQNIKIEDLTPEDRSSEGLLCCSICGEGIGSQLADGLEIVRINCGHIFCKECIAESYRWNPTCPNCRGTIQSPTPGGK